MLETAGQSLAKQPTRADILSVFAGIRPLVKMGHGHNTAALFVLTAVLFGRCWVHFKVWRVHRRMPLLLGFALVALFIWLAENIGTFTAAWMYPSQRLGWTLVSLGKLGAWFLLMIVSYALVALLNRPEKYQGGSG